uniref:Uncharacterized protein n=1 Tax=Panagrolaimus davidi TaxID=227884 RepID=A0A914P2G3_9BILA
MIKHGNAPIPDVTSSGESSVLKLSVENRKVVQAACVDGAGKTEKKSKKKLLVKSLYRLANHVYRLAEEVNLLIEEIDDDEEVIALPPPPSSSHPCERLPQPRGPATDTSSMANIAAALDYCTK